MCCVGIDGLVLPLHAFSVHVFVPVTRHLCRALLQSHRQPPLTSTIAPSQHAQCKQTRWQQQHRGHASLAAQRRICHARRGVSSPELLLQLGQRHVLGLLRAHRGNRGRFGGRGEGIDGSHNDVCKLLLLGRWRPSPSSPFCAPFFSHFAKLTSRCCCICTYEYHPQLVQIVPAELYVGNVRLSVCSAATSERGWMKTAHA